MKHCIIILFLIISCISSSAQFGGGSGDGVHLVSAASLNLAAAENIYNGGANDGHSIIAVNISLTAPNTSYTGGTDDGVSLASANISLGTPGMYGGGTDDGFTTSISNALTLGTNSIYSGGVNDGFDINTALAIPLTPVTSAYSGGADDGTAAILNNATNLAVATMFNGGSDDGFSSLTNNALPLSALQTMFSGGGDDGYTSITRLLYLVVPVKWLRFTAIKKEKDVVLDWLTANEINNKGFDGERSFDGVSFLKIGFIPAAGGTSNTNQYQYIDANPASVCTIANCQVVYYRLKQININQSFDYSQVRLVRLDGTGISFNVFPNPASDRMIVNSSAAGTQKIVYDIGLYNSLGVLIFSKQAVSSSSFEINVRNLASGMYYLRLFADGTTTSYPIFINH